jgi:hypothetical protein
MPDITAPLDVLPPTLGAVAAAVRSAGTRMVTDSFHAACEDAPLASLQVLRRTQFDMVLTFTEQKSEVFLFFERNRVTRRLMEANLQMRIELEAHSMRKAVELQPVRHRTGIPAFLVWRPAPADLATYAPPGATADNTILFRWGPSGARNCLAIMNPDKRENALVRFTRAGIPGPVEPRKLDQQGKTYPAEAFIELMLELRNWTLQEIPATTTVEVREAGAWAVAFRVLDSIAKGYAVAALEMAGGPRMPLDLGYGITAYRAHLHLWVKRDGKLTYSDSPGASKVDAEARIVPGADAIETAINLLPPDFLASGALFDSFIAALLDRADDIESPQLRNLIGPFRDYINAAKPNATVVRVTRNDRDVNLFVLPGRDRAGVPSTLWMRAECDVDVTVSPPKVRLDTSAVSLIHLLHSGFERMKYEWVSYFLEFAADLQKWLREVVEPNA